MFIFRGTKSGFIADGKFIIRLFKIFFGEIIRNNFFKREINGDNVRNRRSNFGNSYQPKMFSKFSKFFLISVVFLLVWFVLYLKRKLSAARKYLVKILTGDGS